MALPPTTSSLPFSSNEEKGAKLRALSFFKERVG
jgi:hypothetical protein